LTLGRLQRRVALGCLAMPFQIAVVPLVQALLVGGIAGDGLSVSVNWNLWKTRTGKVSSLVGA